MIKYIRTKVSKLFAEFTLFSIEILTLFAVFILALLSFILIARMVFHGNTQVFDKRAFDFVASYVSNINTNIMSFFTFLGTHTFLIPANLTLTALYLFVKKRRWNSIKIPAVALTSLLLMFTLKLIFKRDRPLTPLLHEARGYSFPSGHALMSVTFYGLLIVIVWDYIKAPWLRWLLTIFLVAMIFVIGFSRVYLRLHYASDVAAGFCVGLVWLIFSIWILGKLERFSNKKVKIKKDLELEN